MGRETEKSYQRRASRERMVEEFAAELRPKLIEEGRRRAELIRREVEADQFGYVWWHHWERRKVRHMRVLVCGGRNFSNRALLTTKLDDLHLERKFTALMHGGQTGADTMASQWAKAKGGIERYVCKAEWDKYADAAGPIRNARMLDWQPDLVVAFPGGNGTADMVRKARAAGVEVIEVRM